MKKPLLLTIVWLFTMLLQAQQPALTWANKMGGTGKDYGFSIATDAGGNVYSTGYFIGTANMAPTGSFTLMSAGLSDIFISKTDSAGTFVWAKGIGGKSIDISRSIKVDNDGNIYMAGYFNDTVDFDPGPASYPMASIGGADIFILKLNATGDFLWAKQLGSNKGDYGFSIALDVKGNVYTTGDFAGTVDFDPGAGHNYLTSAGSQDAFISKLDKDGNFIWAKAIGGRSYDHGNNLIVDAFENVYTIGYFQDTADIDPGAGVINFMHPKSQGIFILKLDAAGNYKWASHLGGTQNNHYNDGFSIALSSSGYLYTTGYFQDTADFDPGAGVSNLISVGDQDMFILKLDTSGNYIWAKNIGGKSSDIGFSIAVDDKDNCYIAGIFQSTTDFDPGSGTHNLKIKGIRDVFISKYDFLGNYIWAKSMGGSGSGVEGYSIMLDKPGNLYCTGQFNGTVDFDPDAGIVNLTSGSDDIFIFKMNQNGTSTKLDQQFTTNFSLYPNPSSGSFNITLANANNQAVIEIYNTLGTLVYEKKCTDGQNTIDLGDRANGLYIVKVMDGSNVIATMKIMKE